MSSMLTSLSWLKAHPAQKKQKVLKIANKAVTQSWCRKLKNLLHKISLRQCEISTTTHPQLIISRIRALKIETLGSKPNKLLRWI